MYRYNNYLREKTFAEHLKDYIGQTVTIHTTASGKNSSFTGVLLKANTSYVRLLTAFGPSQSGRHCRCRECINNIKNVSNVTDNPNYISSVADIPINQIVSMVHSKI